MRGGLHGDLQLRRLDGLLGCRADPQDLDESIEGRNVLVVEDIIDSGLTLSYLKRTLSARRPASLEICALLTKPERREVDVPVRYTGFEIPNRFVVGYGLDFAERYRISAVGVLGDEAAGGLDSPHSEQALPLRPLLPWPIDRL